MCQLCAKVCDSRPDLRTAPPAYNILSPYPRPRLTGRTLAKRLPTTNFRIHRLKWPQVMVPERGRKLGFEDCGLVFAFITSLKDATDQGGWGNKNWVVA